MTPTAAATVSRPNLDDRADELLEWSRVNAKPLSIAGLVVAALVALVVLYRYSTTQQVRQADAQLAAPQRSIAAGNIPLAQADLKRIITRFGDTPAAAQAAMMLAGTYYQQQKFADGVATLTKAPHGQPYTADIEGLTGDGYSEQGHFVDAATHYVAAAAASKFPAAKMQWQAQAARAYVFAADTADAIKLWTELAKNETSPEAAEAHLRLGELTARPAGK